MTTTPNDEPELPDFLDRRKHPIPILTRHQEAILQLTPEQAALVWAKVRKKFPKLKNKPKGELTPKQLLRRLIDTDTSQADAVLSIVRENTAVAMGAMERMVGKPITRLAEKKSKANGHIRSKANDQAKFDENDKIHCLVENPKKRGGDPWRRFELYREGMTVKEAIAAGVFPADISWDTKHKFIELKHE